MGVLIEVAISLASIVIKAVFLKREREDLNFECPPRKERRQVARQQERVRSSNKYVVLLRGMETIDCSFETLAHLHFIDKQKVLRAFPPALFYISEQLMILKQSLELIEVVIDLNHVRVR